MLGSCDVFIDFVSKVLLLVDWAYLCCASTGKYLLNRKT
jgi:hypothetical protein